MIIYGNEAEVVVPVSSVLRFSSQAVSSCTRQKKNVKEIEDGSMSVCGVSARLTGDTTPRALMILTVFA